MGYQPLEELLPKSGFSNYKLIRMAADRALELGAGRKPMIETKLNDKLATTALEEIRAAKLVLLEVADQFKPEEAEEQEADDSKEE